MAALALAPLFAGSPAAATPQAEEPVARERILALSPDMEAFVADHVGRGPANARLHALLDALFAREHLAVAYSNAETTTAAETFARGSGNCLSFTLMFAALARRAGLEVRFQEVGEVLSWDRRGAVLLNNKHLFAEVQIEGGTVRVDFIPGNEKRYRLMRRAGEARVLAHFYSNVGAERTAVGEPQRALADLRRAVEIDPEFAWAWNNLGVVYRRLGERERAIESYRRAWELDPGDATPLANLANLYRLAGESRKAARFEHRVEAHRRRNPFHHLQLSLAAEAEGDRKLAIEHMRRAVRRAPDDPRMWTRLAELYASAGRRRQAEAKLEIALRHARDEAERERLRERLAALRAGGGAGGEG